MHSEHKKGFFKSHLLLIIILILAITLVAAVSYIIWGKVQQSYQLQLQEAAQWGANQGLQQTVVSLFQQTDKCQVATLYYDNVSRQVIDIACLQPRT